MRCHQQFVNPCAATELQTFSIQLKIQGVLQYSADLISMWLWKFTLCNKYQVQISPNGTVEKKIVEKSKLTKNIFSILLKLSIV